MKTDKEDHRIFAMEKMFHNAFMGFLVVLMMFCVWFVYESVQVESARKAPDMNTQVGQVKPLPAFMLEDIEHDELEKLKP